MISNVVDKVRYKFYTRYIRKGIVRVKGPYWDVDYVRNDVGWWSKDGCWRPQILLEVELESMYQAKLKEKV